MQNFKNLTLWKIAAINGVLASICGVAVAMFLSYAGQLLITANPVFTSIVLLVFMVLITTLVFALVFGKPLTMYLDGERTEAVYALWMTFIVIFVLAGLAMVTAVFIK